MTTFIIAQNHYKMNIITDNILYCKTFCLYHIIVYFCTIIN